MNDNLAYEVFKRLYDYSINGKIIDQEFIYKLIEVMVKNYSLHNYVRQVEFTTNLEKTEKDVTCAAYSGTKKKIIIDSESIQKLISNNTRYVSEILQNSELTFYQNLVIVQIILHELIHAYQDRKANNLNDMSIKTTIIRTSLNFQNLIKNGKLHKYFREGKLSYEDLVNYVNAHQTIYRNHYDTIPIERMAEIDSYNIIIKMLEQVKSFFHQLYSLMNFEYYQKMIRGYYNNAGQFICPTNYYFSKIAKDEIWENFDFYDEDLHQLIKNAQQKYNLSKRLYLGLPITIDEYEKVQQLSYQSI